MVALATLVYSSEAFTDQLAMNQKKQNMNASLAVSLTVRGGNSSRSRGISGSDGPDYLKGKIGLFS